MRRILIVGLAAALTAGLMLLPAGASARHKHTSCPRSARVDRNRDRIPDRWECRHNLSLKVKQARLDPDRDGLNNLGEFEAGDDPHKADSDSDGVKDGAEHAGTIQSFVADPGSPNTGTLTIALDGGGTVIGKVTGDTECKVKPAATAASEGSESGDGEHSGSGDSTSSGDGEHSGTTSGEQENEQGEAQGENEQGENEQGENAQGENEQGNDACSASELTASRVVREAELKITSAGSVFDEIKLA